MATLAQRINDLLAPHIASPGDGSMLQSALASLYRDAPRPSNATELAYLRVEILLCAWNEMHEEQRAERAKAASFLTWNEVGLCIDALAAATRPRDETCEYRALLHRLQEEYRDRSSESLLEEFVSWMAKQGYAIGTRERTLAGLFLGSSAAVHMLGSRGGGRTWIASRLEEFLRDRETRVGGLA